MKEIIVAALIGLVLGAAGMALVGGNQSGVFGAEGDTNFTNVVASGDITSGDDTFVGDDLTVSDDITVSGGAFNLTTSNTATSSATIGCIQTYATSTATAVRFVLSSAGTTTATYNGTLANGGVSWQYGTCPI